MPLQTQLRQCNTEPQPNTSTPSTEWRWWKASLIWTVRHLLEESCTPSFHPGRGSTATVSFPARKVDVVPSWPWLWELLPAQLTLAGISCVTLQLLPAALKGLRIGLFHSPQQQAPAVLWHVALRLLKLLSLDISYGLKLRFLTPG